MAKSRRRRSLGRIGKIGSMKGLFGLGALAGMKEDAIQLGVLGAGAAAGSVLGGVLTSKVPWLKDQAAPVKGAVCIGVGVLLGIVAGYANLKGLARDALVGVAVGKIAGGAVTLLNHYAPQVTGGAVAGIYGGYQQLSAPVLREAGAATALAELAVRQQGGMAGIGPRLASVIG